jgi:hypothetical protein
MCVAKYVFAVAAATACSDAFAGVAWLSRANCVAGVVNESVTYDRPELTSHYMYTESDHVGLGSYGGHVVAAPWNVTWRSYAGDLRDPERNTVRGLHIFGNDMAYLTTHYTVTTDCNLTEW